MPPLDGSRDPKRPPEGPPAEPVKKWVVVLMSTDTGEWKPVGFVTETQLREDIAQWFAEAPNYIERVATVMDALPGRFKDFPYTSRDLRARLGRIGALGEFVDTGLQIIDLGATSLYVERADAVRMADMVMADLDADIGRPFLDSNTRDLLLRASELPMKIWRDRQAQIQNTKQQNATAETHLAEAQQQVADLTAEQQAAGTVTVGVQPGTHPAPPQTVVPAGKRLNGKRAGQPAPRKPRKPAPPSPR